VASDGSRSRLGDADGPRGSVKPLEDVLALSPDDGPAVCADAEDVARIAPTTTNGKNRCILSLPLDGDVSAPFGVLFHYGKPVAI
jgi:hypothetical protein